MVRIGFGRLQRTIRRHFQPDILDLRDHSLDSVESMFHSQCDLRIEIVEEIFPRNTDPQTLRAFLHSRHIVQKRNIRTRDICRIESRNHLQHDSGIRDTSRQWPHMIQ